VLSLNQTQLFKDIPDLFQRTMWGISNAVPVNPHSQFRCWIREFTGVSWN